RLALARTVRPHNLHTCVANKARYPIDHTGVALAQAAARLPGLSRRRKTFAAHPYRSARCPPPPCPGPTWPRGSHASADATPTADCSTPAADPTARLPRG